MEHQGYENTGNNHPLKRLVIIKQLLLINNTGKVLREQYGELKHTDVQGYNGLTL